MALNILTLGSEPGMDKILPGGIVEATENLLLGSGAIPDSWVRWSRTKSMTWVYRSFDWMLPGMYLALAYRKAFFEQQVRAAIGSGATQVLIPGAGYDTLGWRLAPEFSSVHFHEIDHPATARFKARGIEAMGRRENLHLLQADLGELNLADVLTAVDSWDPAGETAILAEGLLMYLPEDTVRDLFVQCSRITGTGSRMVFDYLRSGADGRPDAGPWTASFLWLIKITGEPWRWSIHPEDLSKFLDSTGWTNAPDLVELSDKCGVEFLAVAVK
ncbi:MAG: SAM-dependent methyltransferase [Desulfobacteraceae bacterium]|nr:SAM-dependent methyltransferase [Desulfobacteraceae bacterium]